MHLHGPLPLGEGAGCPWGPWSWREPSPRPDRPMGTAKGLGKRCPSSLLGGKDPAQGRCSEGPPGDLNSESTFTWLGLGKKLSWGRLGSQERRPCVNSRRSDLQAPGRLLQMGLHPKRTLPPLSCSWVPRLCRAPRGLMRSRTSGCPIPLG